MFLINAEVSEVPLAGLAAGIPGKHFLTCGREPLSQRVLVSSLSAIKWGVVGSRLFMSVESVIKNRFSNEKAKQKLQLSQPVTDPEQVTSSH